MESLCPAESDRASDVSFCIDEDVFPETVLNSEEAEDLTHSFKEAVNTGEVKPKLQCLMSNPAFSMVTVQCEDSGIHWETTSSRCSTPWASEASTTSDVYSMESSSAGTPPGKVIFIMDEGKLLRKRVRPSTSAKFAHQSSHHKKSTENHKASADNMGESFKQALEKAKRHLSTHTEEAGSADCSAKDTENHTGENPNVPVKDSSSENKPPDERTSAAEPSIILPDKVAEEPTCAVAEHDKTPTPSGLNNDCEGSAMCPTKSVPEKQTVTETVKQLPQKNTTKPKGRVYQSLAKSSTEMISSKHDIDSYPPYVLEELSTVLEKINKLCNPLKDDSQKNTNDPPNTQSNVFSIVSDGSEILNILAPDLISSVDQEASKEMEDKLEYLEENPLLVPKLVCTEDESPITYEESVRQVNGTVEEEIIIPEKRQTDKTVYDIDYFEKFTLVDSNVPIEPPYKRLNQEQEAVKEEHLGPSKSESSSDDDYYLLQSLDESFYGVSLDGDTTVLQPEAHNPEKSITKEDTEKKDKDVKNTNGGTLFSSEEGVLTKSLFFPTSYPVNHELLEEPPALAFLYADLYEQARGCKAKEEHDPSDAESTSSDKTFHSRISDDDGTGIYFEKFNLKDEIPPGGEKSDEDEFYSDEGSDEEQYLSYEALSQGSLVDKNTNQKEIFIEDNKSPSLYDKVQLDDEAHLLNDACKVPPTDNVPVTVTTEWKNLGDEENTEDLDYAIVSPDDLDEDDVSLKEIMFEDQESLEHESDMFLDAVQVTPEHEESGFEMVEHEKKSEDILEPPLSEDRKAQIDTYCNICKIPIVAIDKIFGDHKNHNVTALDTTVNEMTSNLENLLEKLQESSLKTEDCVTRVEKLFNDVEKNCSEAEKSLVDDNEKLVQKVIDQHKQKRECFEEVKKMKMDYLYDQMVSFQQSVDSAKEILEKAAKEIEELDPVMFLNAHNDINSRVLKAIENTVSLDKIPSAFSLFDHIAAKSKDDQKTVKHLPVPQTPKLKPQEHNSATSTSITVYWTMSEEDVIDCFQVYCMEEPQGKGDENGLLEEYRVTVKESFCILEDLEPDKCYSVWVMAVNYTGCSLPSDKSIFRTAPSTPVIKAEECTVCWDTAVIRWSTSHLESTESFTLEWCKQYSSEGEGLRSVAGIKDQQLRVSLQPGENYFFYVKAGNTFGSSEQSEAALISTKGTRFHLLRDTAHPALDLSPDGTVISIVEQREIVGIPLVLGELLPAKGQHYWEMMVAECCSYSVGATFHPSPEESATTQDSTSWCMQCSSSCTSFSYRFLHNEIWSEVHLTEHPVRVGVLLDYRKGKLSFYNVQKGQLLFTFRHRFTEAAHPTFALEAPGEIHLHTGIELPHFTKQS
ncbi:cardiomyopathy-associated protein 5 [Bufo bufo]|uniref:cardiomyopathy-associated protein 5 n=1 Tax=Bufo bufo TaxID=8384 RepID=UPI001ABDA57C|nr:cardiomyopathy-associated protein 5 [Bufo bufo]